MNFHGLTNSYWDDRYKTILWLEETGNPHLTPYNDRRGNVSIGIGFNLRDATVRRLVFAKMGITNTILISSVRLN